MITELNKRRLHLKELGLIDDQFYENIFNVYKIDRHYIYNILRKINIPQSSLDERFFYNTIVQASFARKALHMQKK